MPRAILRLAVAALLLTALVGTFSVAGAAPAAQPQPAEPFTVYLPLLRRPPEVELRAGASSDQDGAVVAPLAELPAGATELHVDARLRGALGQTYRVEILTPPGQVFEVGSGTIYAEEQLARASICYASFGACTGRPLPASVYTVRALLDEQPVREVAVMVQ